MKWICPRCKKIETMPFFKWLNYNFKIHCDECEKNICKELDRTINKLYSKKEIGKGHIIDLSTGKVRRIKKGNT